MPAPLILVWLVVSASSADKLHDRAEAAFNAAEFAKAAELLRQELSLRDAQPADEAGDLRAREMLVFALYFNGQQDGAVDAFRELRRRHPKFQLDKKRVLPETIAFFESRAPKPTPEPASLPGPRVVKEAEAKPRRVWHWYYLAPLGIGQFLARSPVRGSLFLTAELGFLAANITGLVLINREVRSDGTVANRASQNRAATAQIVMDIGFVGAIASFVAAAVDGIFFEP